MEIQSNIFDTGFTLEEIASNFLEKDENNIFMIDYTYKHTKKESYFSCDSKLKRYSAKDLHIFLKSLPEVDFHKVKFFFIDEDETVNPKNLGHLEILTCEDYENVKPDKINYVVHRKIKIYSKITKSEWSDILDNLK